MAGLWARVFHKSTRHSQHLYLFPLLAGTAWFTTLTTLLIRWFALHQPRYPGQVNPSLPFISDIGAFTFQPLFIAGCTLTGVTFAGTVFAVHHVRYSDKFYGLTEDAEWRQRTSFAAVGLGLVAAACLVLLSVFDTFENPVEHQFLLMGTFAGLGASGLLTTAVWWDQIWGPVRFAGLRKWCLLTTAMAFSQVMIGAAFVALLHSGKYYQAGILEWTLSYLGSLWLVSFVGYTRFREDGAPPLQIDHERQPLLSRRNSPVSS